MCPFAKDQIAIITVFVLHFVDEKEEEEEDERERRCTKVRSQG